jgi:putative ABC transport system permease protein
MAGAAALAAAHARHHRVRTALLVVCVLVAVFLPLATRVLGGELSRGLLERAESTPLLAGAKGSRFDLVMSGLYFRRTDLATITMADWRELQDSGLAGAIPLNTRFTARGLPVVATSPDYFEARALVVRSGGLPARVGEVVLGAEAAVRLGLHAGDSVFSDQRQVFDITVPPALKLHVVGVLERAGTADDGALFADIKTAWALEGLAHGHADAARSVPESLLLDRGKDRVVVSEEMVEYNELGPENLASFHVHAEASSLPLTGVLLLPRSDKDLAILKARANAGRALQIIVPRESVEEVLGYVAKLRGVLDGLSLVLGGFVVVLLGLVTALSVRTRAREVETLAKVGVGPTSIAAIFGWEIAMTLAAGCFVAAAAAGVLALAPPDLVKLL